MHMCHCRNVLTAEFFVWATEKKPTKQTNSEQQEHEAFGMILVLSTILQIHKLKCS